MRKNIVKKNVSDLADLIFNYYPYIRKWFRDLVSIKNIPISMTQLTCLNIIASQEKLTMTELAENLNMSNQQLTKVVDALVDLKLAERAYDDTNRRKIYAVATPEGQQVLTSLKVEIEIKLGKALNKRTAKEIDNLYHSLKFLAKYFN